MTKKILVSLFISLLSVLSAAAQTGSKDLILENGVKAHREIDRVYSDFSKAYRELNVDQVANLYSETAAYLPPDREIINGRVAIRDSFKSFFDRVKDRGQNISITFQIFQRRARKDMAYDVGIYTLRSYENDKEVGSGQGKFIVVAVKETDGKWRFQVDAYNGLKPPKEK